MTRIHKTSITVCVVEKSQVFVCDADRFILPWLVEEIERDLNTDDDPWWPDGAVTVKCTVTHSPAEMDYSSDEPRIAIPAYWDISDVQVLEPKDEDDDPAKGETA